MTIVYKAVVESLSSLTGYRSITRWRYSVSYEIGITTLPEIGYLMAFDTLENAKVFIANTTWVVLSCEAEVIKENIDYIPYPSYLELEAVEEFWRGRNLGLSIRVPIGTVFCKSIKPLARLLSIHHL